MEEYRNIPTFLDRVKFLYPNFTGSMQNSREETLNFRIRFGIIFA